MKKRKSRTEDIAMDAVMEKLFGEPKQDDPEPPPTILAEAEGLIYGEREGDYGHPSYNLDNIAHLWSAYLDSRPGFSDLPVPPHNITRTDVALLMLLLKVARAIPGASSDRVKRDTVVDAAGYLGLIERVEGLK